MTKQKKLEKVIKGLECRLDVNGSKFTHCLTCDYRHDIDHCQWACQTDGILEDALALLKAQEKATIEPKRIDLDDETKAWLDKMDAVDALGNIADICMDWDGYRTADGLGGLVNEIWAYARYCADRLLKVQEPVKPTRYQEGRWFKTWRCGACGGTLVFRNGEDKPNYCTDCGRAVKWE